MTQKCVGLGFMLPTSWLSYPCVHRLLFHWCPESSGEKGYLAPPGLSEPRGKQYCITATQKAKKLNFRCTSIVQYGAHRERPGPRALAGALPSSTDRLDLET